MVHNLRFLIITFFFVFYYTPTISVAFCPCSNPSKPNANPPVNCKKNHKETLPPKVVKIQDPLEIIKDLFKTIKEDSYNQSYAQMLEDVKAEHSIKYHKPNAPFFYSNDSFVMKDIIDLLLDDPDGYIDETKTKGILMVYRDNNYHEEIEELFDREPLYRRDIPQPKKFQKDYLGQTMEGPTNRVMVTLKLKGDEQNENTLEKRLAYIGNNIVFIDAFPAKGPPPPAKPKGAQPVSGGKAEAAATPGGKPDQGKPEISEGEETAPEAGNSSEGAEKGTLEAPKAVEGKAEESAPEAANTEDSTFEDTMADEGASEER
jgi:hypothetical protein